MLLRRSSVLAIAVDSIRAAGQAPPGDLRDIAPAVEMPPDPVWPTYLTVSLCLVVLIAAIILLVRRRRPQPIPVRIPPHEIALEALARLDRDRYEPRTFYIRLIEILRAYFADRFSLVEPDATASELTDLLFRSTTITPEDQQFLRNLVIESDLVKFAACSPSPDSPERAIIACRKFIHNTAVVEEEVMHAP